jgi:hypothetical protein
MITNRKPVMNNASTFTLVAGPKKAIFFFKSQAIQHPEVRTYPLSGMKAAAE